MTRGPIRVLVAEDSALFVEAIVAIVEADPELRVVGIAKNGEQALAMTESLSPDVVLMDVFMPVLDGLSAVQAIMARCPTPILVMTASPIGPTGSLAFEALSRGALDLIAKPTTWSGTRAERDDLCARLKLIASVRVVRLTRGTQVSSPRAVEREAPSADPPGRLRVLGLGASTGGPPALAHVLAELPAEFPLAIVVVQHLSTGFDLQLVSWLKKVSALNVMMAEHGQPLAPGTVLVAPCDRHLVVEASGNVALSAHAARGGHRPSVDVLFSSIAMTCGKRGAAVLFTGMGADGAKGMLEMRERGALTIAQDEASSVIFGMPKAAIDMNAAREVVPLDDIATTLCRHATVSPRRPSTRVTGA